MDLKNLSSLVSSDNTKLLPKRFHIVVMTLLALVLSVTTAYAFVIIPSGATVTDPLAQGYPTCTPGNCVIATSTSSGSLPTASLSGQSVIWNGTTWEATSSLQVNGATPTATTNNIFVSGFLKLLNALGVNYGGTGTTTAPTFGQLLMGNVNGTYDLVATSSLGLSAQNLTNNSTTTINAPVTNLFSSTTNITSSSTNIVSNSTTTLSSPVTNINSTTTNITSSGTTTLTSLNTTINSSTTNINSSSTNITGTTTLSTLVLGTLTGFLKAVGGETFATSSISLLTDVLGVLGINFGGTGTTTAPAYGQILIGNNSGTYDLVSTSTLFVASSTFASSTAIGATIQNATQTGIFFLDSNGQLAQDTANFNYDSVSKKLTITGGVDPLFLQLKDVTTASGSGAYFEAFAGNNAATSSIGNGRIRYNASTSVFETSVNGGAYIAIGSGSGGSLASGTATSSTLFWNGIAWVENVNFLTDAAGNSTSTNSTTTNSFISNILSSLTAIFTNLTSTNATITNATSTNFVSNFINSVLLTITGTSSLATTTSTDFTSNNISANGIVNVTGTTTLATTTISNLNLSALTVPTATVGNLTATNTLVTATTTIATATIAAGSANLSNATITNASSTYLSSTFTNAGELTAGTTTLGTTTISTSSVSNLNVLATLWANILAVLNFTATNATITNATTTNFASANIVNSGTSTLATTTTTSLTANNLGVGTTTSASTTLAAFRNVANGGVTWTSRSASEANTWSSVTYGNGTFVAVANSGTNRVMTSPDGITWTARTAAEANAWWAVTYGGGQFVAISTSGTNQVMTSPDGITWTARAAAAANSWRGIVYANGKFVAVAQSGANRVMTSPDGITWTSQTAVSSSWRSVTYGNGVYVAVAESGTDRVMTSPDGITWTAQTASEANSWQSVIYAGGQFVAVAFDGTNSVMTSPDGITWTARAASEASAWNSVTYANGTYVAVAAAGTNRVMTSTDAITWTSRSASEGSTWYSVTSGNGLLVAVAVAGGNQVMTSVDGPTGSTNLLSLGTSLNSNVLVVDDRGYVGVGTTTGLTNLFNINGAITLNSSTPASTANALYNQSGTLYFNGTALGAGGGGSNFLTLLGATSTDSTTTAIRSGGIILGTTSTSTTNATLLTEAISSTTIAALIRGAVGQLANYLQIQTASGTDLFTVATTGTTISSNLNVTGTTTLSTTTSTQLIIGSTTAQTSANLAIYNTLTQALTGTVNLEAGTTTATTTTIVAGVDLVIGDNFSLAGSTTVYTVVSVASSTNFTFTPAFTDATATLVAYRAPSQTLAISNILGNVLAYFDRLGVLNSSGVTLTSNGNITTTSNTLYNQGGQLYFNGSSIGGVFTLNSASGTITNSSSTAALVFDSQPSISTTSNALYNQGGTLYWNGNQLASGLSSANVIFGENISAGQAVRLVSEGGIMKAYSANVTGSGVAGQISSLSTGTVVDDSVVQSAYSGDTVWVNDSTVVVGFRNNIGGNFQRFRAGTVSGTTPTFGTIFTSAYAGENNYLIPLPRSGGNRFIGLGNQTTNIGVFSVSGTTITEGTRGTLGFVTGSPSISGVETAVDEVAVIGSNSGSPVSINIVDISGTSISSISSNITVDSSPSATVSSYGDNDITVVATTSATSTIAVTYVTGTNIYMRVGDVNSTTNTVVWGGAPVSIAATTVSDHRIIRYADRKVALMFYNSAGNTVQMQLVSIDGSNVPSTLGGVQTITSVTTSTQWTDLNSTSDNVLLAQFPANGTNPSAQYLYPITVSGSVITVGTPNILSASAAYNQSNGPLSINPSGTNFATTYALDNTNYYPRLVLGVMSSAATDNRSNYYGLVSSSSVANATGTVQLYGSVLSNVVTNLVAGATYYIDTAGQLTTNVTNYVAGKALSSNQLSINAALQTPGSSPVTSGVVASYMSATLGTAQTVNSGIITAHAALDVVNAQYGNDITLDTTTTYSETTNAASKGRFTLKAGKTYRLLGVISSRSTGSEVRGVTWWNSDTNTKITGSTEGNSVDPTNTSIGGYSTSPSAEVIYTPAVDTRVELRMSGGGFINGTASSIVLSSSVSSGGTMGGRGDTYAFIEVIAGNAAVTGQSVDYVEVSRITSNQTGINSTSTADLIFNNIVSGSIPYDTTTGVFTLTAGKTYELIGNPYFYNFTGGGGINTYLQFNWVDATTNLALTSTSTSGIVASSQATVSSSNDTSQGTARLIYTPTTNQTVKLRITGSGGTSAQMYQSSSHATIKQLGTTATTEYSNNILGNFTSSQTIMSGTLSEYINHIQIAQASTSLTLSIPSPANTSLSRIVYIDNTGTANFDMHGVTVGAGESNAFKWNGTTWKSFGAQANNVAAEYGEVQITDGTIFNAATTTIATVTLPTAGVWRVDYYVYGVNSAISDNAVALFDSTGVLVAETSAVQGQQGAGAVSASGPILNSVNITTSGSATYTLRGRTSTGTFTVRNTSGVTSAGESKIKYQKIGGYLPVVGQIVDYYNITWSTGTAAAPGLGVAYNFSPGTVLSQTGNIPFNGTTAWTLTAGKTYRLSANMAAGSISGSQVAWYNDSTGLQISNSQSSVQDSGSSAFTTSGSAEVVITPSTNITVSLRAVTTNQSLLLGRSAITIQQLGTSATTGFSFSAMTNQLVNNTLDNFAFTNIWNWSSATSTTNLQLVSNSLTTGTLLSLVASSSSSTSLALNVSGSLALAFGNNYATSTRYARDVDFGAVSRVRVIATTSNFFGITGIAGGVAGEQLTIVNGSSTASFILYDQTSTTSSISSNRIITGTGADLTVAGDTAIQLVYDQNASSSGRWRVVGGSGSGGSNFLTSTGVTATDTTSFIFRNGGLAVGTTSRLTVASSSTLYIAGDVWNTLSTTSIRQVGQATIAQSPYAVAIKGKYAYVTRSGASMALDAVDISNPSNISWNTTYSLPAGSQPNYITINGNYAYVLNFAHRSMNVFDVSVPGTLNFIASTTFSGVGPHSMIVNGNYGYVANRSSNFMTVLDLSNPALPVQIATTSIGATQAMFAIDGRYMYSTNYGGNSLSVIDLRDPSRPVVIGSNVGGGTLNAPWGIAVSGQYVYVGNSGTTNINVYQRNGANLTFKNTITSGAGPVGLSVQGRYMYVANNADNSINIFDISSSTAPLMLASTTLTNAAQPIYFAQQGRNMFVASNGAGSFYLTALTVGGIDTNAINTGLLDATDANISGTLNASGDINAKGLNVGLSGLVSYGQLSLLGIATSTAGLGTTTIGASIYIASSTPATTTNSLYQQGGTLYWNGTTIGLSAYLSSNLVAATPYANNLSLGGGANTSMRISATTTAFLGITGFATSTVSNGTIITITNASSTGSFVLYNQSASSTAGNRIITGTGGDITIPSDASVELKYDGISLAWRVLGNWGANPGATTVTNVSATTTLSTWGRTIIVDASSGPFTITLPNPTLTSGGIIEFKRTDSTTNAVTIDGYASSTIDGSISVDLPNGNNSMIIRSDGTNAKILGGSGGAGGVMSYARLVKNTTTAINLQNTMNFNFDAVEYSNGLTANATTDTITVNRSGRYRIDFYTSPQSLAADHSISVYVNGVQNGTTTMIDFNTADNIVSMTFERDLLAGDVVAIRGDGTSDVIDFAGVASGVNSYFAMTQISASSLVTGQSVDYVLAKKTAIQTITNAADQGSVTWQSTAGNIPLVSGTTTLFQLSAGKTYKLEGHLAICNAGSGNCADSGAGTGGGRLRYKWVDSTNTPVGSVNTIGITKTTTGTTDSNGDTNALAIFTPTTDTQVKLYVFDVDTSNMIITYGTTTSPDASSDTYASIEQIGSSATTEYENNIYGDYPTGGYVATGTLSQYTNFIQVAQTTVGQTLLLPTPANQNLARLVYVDNTGSADFSMYSPNGTANVAAGESAFFKWNGSAWKSLTNATALAAEYGTTVLGVSPTTIASGVTNFATSQSLMTFTLPSAGVYEVQTSIRGFTNSIANNAVNVAIADPSANLVTNSEMLAAFSNTTTGFSSNAEGTVRITATSAGTYTVKVWNTNNTNSAQIYSDGNGRSAVNWKKISGYIPVIGQSVDYIHAKKSTAQNNVADESDITFQTSDGNMNLAGNTTITLYAGKTYSLSAELYVNYGDSDVGDSITISWVDANTGVAYASAQSIIVTTNTTVDCDAGGTSCSDEASIQDISPLASVTLTPTVDTQVSLRVKSTTGTADIPSGYMLIQQLGSTNIVSGFSFSSFVAAIASQIVDNTNFAQIWNWSTATSTNALTMSAPALTTGNLLVLNSSSTSGNALLVNGLASFNGTSTFASTTFSGTVGIGTSTNRYGGLLTKGLTLNNSLVLASSTALSTTSLALYNSNGTLMWNGTALATNSSLPASTTSLYVGASGAVSVGTSTTGTSSTLFIQGTSSNANALTIQGNVSNLINTSLPPIQVATNTSTSSPQSVTIYGKYMFNANFTTGNINITDISNPTNPKKISSIATGAGATDVKVSGRYAYVTNFNVPSLSVVDIGNIFAPTVVGSVTIGAGAGYSAIYGNYVLTSNQTAQTMSVISVANPASPVVVATASLGTLPGPITVHGKYAYVVNATTGNFQIFDLSNPINPTLISSPTLAGARAIAVAGRFAYVSGSSNTLAVFDVANPSSASQVGTISLPTGGILGMAVSGRYVYMAASSGKLIVADIASSTSPTILTSTTVGTASANIRDVAVSGRYAYLANSGDSSIAIVDLSGAEFANITAGTLSVGNIISDGSMSLLGGLTVGTNINVGTGGINSYGGINVMGTTSISSIMGRLTVGTTTSNSSFGLQAISTSSPIFTLASSTGANVLTVSAAGNVGIATSSPSTKLAIQYSAAFGGSTAGVGAVEIVNTDASLNGARITLANANGSRAWITGDGQNGLYVTVGSAGVSLATGGTSWVAVSDARLKSNVLNLNASSSVLEKIDGLRPVTYDLYNGNHEVGFIAQEVLPFFPELVTLPKNASSTCSSDNQDGCFKLNYDRFAVVALQGLKELNAKIFGTNDVQAISIEEITASSTISFDDKLKALGVNAKNVNDMLAQLASSTSATSSVTTTETVNTSTQTLSCNANNAVGESMSGGIVTAITSTTTPIAVEGQIPQTIYSCVVTTYATTTTTVEDLTFVGKLIARIVEEVKTYLASATSVFISKVETNEICVKKADGTPVCLNAEQLEGIKNSLNSAPQSPAAPPTAPEPLTCTDEQTLDENTNTCVDNVPTSLPEEPEIPENPPAEIPASP